MNKIIRLLNSFFVIWLSLGMLVQFILFLFGRSIHEPNKKIAALEATITTGILGFGIWGLVQLLIE